MLAGHRVYVRKHSQPSATFHNRSQPFATVRNHPREDRMDVPMRTSAKGVTFGGFQHGVASFRVAGVALRDFQTCFVACRKSFCTAGAILLRRFQKMRCIFRGKLSTLATSIFMLRGMPSTSDASCGSFCQGCAKWCGSLAQNINFEVAHFEVQRKTPTVGNRRF